MLVNDIARLCCKVRDLSKILEYRVNVVDQQQKGLKRNTRSVGLGFSKMNLGS